MTRQPEASSAALFFLSNAFTFLCVNGMSARVLDPRPFDSQALLVSPVMDALRAGPDASPPFNMRNSMIFTAAFMCFAGALVFGLDGNQSRTRLDREKISETEPMSSSS